MNRRKTSYRSTVTACYFASFSQAIVINLTPVLFIPLREQFGFSYGALGFLVFINFITQVVCDLAFAGVSDRFGFRPLAAASPFLACAGLALFALVPMLFPGNIYLGLVLATILFSAAGGLLEITVSPILQAIPGDEKAAAMSILHSFYGWGQLAVVLLTSLWIFFFGSRSWQVIALLWAAFPLVAGVLFSVCPLAPPVPEGVRQRAGELLRKPFLIAAFLAIFFGAGTELGISQWSSAFAEKALKIPKLWGDIAGMSLFALMLGLGRLLHGIFGAKLDLAKLMAACAFSGIFLYLAAGLSPFPAVSLAACGLAGLASSLLWPGTLSLAGMKFPGAGAWMFALLACAGDIGGAAVPWAMGLAADGAQKIPFLAALASRAGLTGEQLGLRAALVFASLIPAAAGFTLVWMGRDLKKGADPGRNLTP